MVKEVIFESPRTKIILTKNETFGVHIRKILNIQYPSPQQIKQFYTEYEIAQDLNRHGFRKAYESKKEQNVHTILLEYIDGITLDKWLEKSRTLLQKIRVSKQLADNLSLLHSIDIIHRDLSGSNILIDRNTREAKIIDFGYSSRFNTKYQHLVNPETLVGTLPYISPEQTGRMNRTVDYRTDLYAVGVLMYKIFTGRLPFASKDPVGLVHAHIAIIPDHPQSILDDIPDVICEIILKLLSKNADDRYDSALGLSTDLQRIIDMLEGTGSVDTFEIALSDFSGRFHIHEQLYGRDAEIKLLYNSFDYVSSGQSELILIGGFSGTGKSSLVKEIYRPVTEKNGLFLEGKFDQFQKGLPYFAIIHAIDTFVNGLLTEHQDVIETYKMSIQSALGEEGKVLTDIVPDLELIIGKQADVPEIGGTEAQNRFNYVFRKFINAISTAEHPVVFFVDDVQWSDSASLDLISSIMTDIENEYFMCICAYRDNEVDISHPFTRMVEDLKQRDVKIEEIILNNLSVDNVNELIAHSTDLTTDQVSPLTELVYEKTGGNAFFVNQYLNSLYELEHLKFDYSQNRWSWDMDQIRAQALPDDVVSLMTGKIARLPEKTRQAIKLAACVGASFEIATLSIIAEKSIEDLENDLQKGLAEGLIQANDDIYFFSHDRIQQAAYSLIPIDERPPLHHTIGKLMEQRMSEDEFEEKLFDVVNQFNLGQSMITSEAEKNELMRLNLRAGIKAKDASAFKAALGFLGNGIKFLTEDHWTKQYDESLALYTNASECAFLTSDFEQMESNIQQVEKNGKDILAKLKALEVRIHAMKAEQRLLDALNAGLDILDQLDEKLPRKPHKMAIASDLIKTIGSLRGQADDTILNLPLATDPYKAAAMRICAIIAPSSYWANPDVFPFIIWRMLRLSMHYGNTPVSSFGYATHGVILVGIFKQFKSGNRFANLGLEVLNKLKAKEWIAQVYTAVFGLIKPWNEHIQTTLKPLQDSYHIGLETGAIEFGCVNANLYCIHGYFMGNPLKELEAETKAYSANFESYKQGVNQKYNEVYRQAMLNLLTKTDQPTILTGDAINEESYVKNNEELKDRTGTFFYYFHKLILCYLFDDYKQAWSMAEEGRKLLDAVLAKMEVAYFHYYEGLVAAAILLSDSPSDSSHLKSRLKKNIRQFDTWAKYAPMNFLHKKNLLKAEYFSYTKQFEKAKSLYESAISGSIEYKYINDEAISYLRLSHYYLQQSNLQLQGFYLNKAYHAFKEWGADAITYKLTQSFPDNIFSTAESKRKISSTDSSSIDSHSFSKDIDISSIVKASNLISQEIVLPKLLQQMMSVLVENMGATKAALVLIENGALRIGIITHSNGNSDHILEGTLLKGSDVLPEKLISYTKRTEEQLVFENIQLNDSFAKDEYIIRQKPISIVSYPIVHQGKIKGVLYFENNLTNRAFNEARIQLLSLLSGQIATSLENALLYENLEKKVMQRTAQLAEEKKKSDELLLNILPSKTAEELKQKGYASPVRFNQITVMFTDFVDFTRISSKMEPVAIVSIIDRYFTMFDDIIVKYGIEKIKTIGDAYMCASGMDNEMDHAILMIKAACEMRAFMKQEKEIREKNGEDSFAIRIGIHSGPVVAGVVGSKKFAYDIWGDTVNVASRMESNCEEWNINISGETHKLVQEKYECFHRGKVEAKNRGKIDMYYILHPK